MSGVCRMQELKYFRDGATLVISLDGLNWLSKRRCSDEGIKKRDEALQLLKSAGQMIQADEDLQPITCVCILDQRGSAGPQLWRNSHCRSSLVTQAQPFSIPPRHCCLPEEPTRHSTFPFLASFVSECPKGTPWTRLILNMQDVFSLIKKTLNTVTQQVTTDWHNSFIIFCDEDIPLQRFGDTCHTEDYRTSVEDSGWHISDNNMLSDLKNSTALWPHGPNTINSRVILHELVSRDNFNTCNLKSLLKSRQIYDAPGVLSGKDTNVKKKKSVSFDDDVTVYLFDQESPTLELHTGPHTSLPSNYSCNPSDVTLEDSGLEWEDDFSALEKDCHFQCVRHSVSQHYHLPVPTQSCTALSRPERFFLSQTFLFLTHVTESDLEL